LLAVNKVDTAHAEPGVAEFAALGFEKLFPVTAIHGEGIEALMKEAAKFLNIAERQEPKIQGDSEIAELDSRPSTPDPLKLAIVGRPNVGKSSIINALTRSERVIVSPIPGTTRDAIDVPFEIETEGTRERYLLIDTAGVRKERRVHDSIEFYSIKRT